MLPFDPAVNEMREPWEFAQRIVQSDVDSNRARHLSFTGRTSAASCLVSAVMMSLFLLSSGVLWRTLVHRDVHRT